MTYRTEIIKNIVLDIGRNKYLLPAIQREFVWGPSKIENLFDSILSGYPFGSLLFWKYHWKEHGSGTEDNNYVFYKFIDKYDEYDTEHNARFDIKGDDCINCVLDGQQRLTSLYIGLKGCINVHKKYKAKNKPENYNKKNLYINLLHTSSLHEEDSSSKNKFACKFKTKEEVESENSDQNNKTFWYEIGKVLDWSNKQEEKRNIKDDIINIKPNLSNDDIDTIDAICDNLYDKINKEQVINYFDVTANSLDEVLNIFIRINSSGTPLSYSDFLMSIVTSYWSEARDKVIEAVSYINKNEFNLDNDIFLRGCLFLTNSNVRFKVENFKKETIDKIIEEFDSISKNMQLASEFFKSIGYHKYNLKAKLIILPVALFLKKKNIDSIDKIDKEDKANIMLWIARAIITSTFGSHTDSKLTKMQHAFNNTHTNFPTDELLKISDNIDEEGLDSIINEAFYGNQKGIAILTLLFPHKFNSFTATHTDHIYPISKLDKNKKEYGNSVLNLQILTESENLSKGNKDADSWIKEQPKEYSKDNLIPDMDLTMDNYDDFIEKRRDLLKARLKEILKIN